MQVRIPSRKPAGHLLLDFRLIFSSIPSYEKSSGEYVAEIRLLAWRYQEIHAKRCGGLIRSRGVPTLLSVYTSRCRVQLCRQSKSSLAASSFFFFY
jgi:hypothetical protein